MTPLELIRQVESSGGRFMVKGDRLGVAPAGAAEPILEELRLRKAEIIELLAQRPSMPEGAQVMPWPVPLSYPEHFCRMRAAGFVPCSREEWEAEHGRDADRMARYERLCRWGVQ